MKALILIDIQKGFDDQGYWGGARNNVDMEANALALLAHWREQSWPVVHIRHNSDNPASPLHPEHEGNAFKDGFAPDHGEVEFTKTVNSAFIGTGLEEYLRENGFEKLVICGISTQHCVSTTTRMAGNLGFEVELVADACHAWPMGGYDAQTIHDVEIAILSDEFAKIRSTQDIIETAGAHNR